MDTRDWSLCFLCQLQKSNEKALDPPSSFKLRNNPVCYKEVTVNIQKLKELGDLPDFIVVDDISGGAQEDLVQLMMSNPVVWHKSCRNANWQSKGESKKKKEESGSFQQTHLFNQQIWRSVQNHKVPIVKWSNLKHKDVLNIKRLGTVQSVPSLTGKHMSRYVHSSIMLIPHSCVNSRNVPLRRPSLLPPTASQPNAKPPYDIKLYLVMCGFVFVWLHMVRDRG